MDKRKIGKIWEDKACLYLKNSGITILETNYKVYRRGEIDIIGCDPSGTLIFFEVKYRKSTENGMPQEAVDFRKQQKICNACDYYRASHEIGYDRAVRFDVLAIYGQEITWIKNAFMYIGRG